jgi:predicted nucleic acid-binding protein
VKRIIVDASVLIAGLMADGTVRDLLLTRTDLAFCAPSFVETEVKRHLKRISDRADLPTEMVQSVLTDLLGTIDLIPRAVYSSALGEARQLSRDAGAHRDEDYVALALSLACEIWTLDKDFGRVKRIRTLDTRAVDQLD